MELKNKRVQGRLAYNKLFWVFMMGCVLGVFLEGLFCIVKKGEWEAHVVSIFGWFNILYGFCSVMFYVFAVKLEKIHLLLRLLIMIAAATLFELLSGWLLRYGLGMKAWAYTNQWLNFQTIICPKYSLYWGLVALVFCLTEKYLSRLLCCFDNRPCNILCIILSVFMFVNLAITTVSIVRWSERHFELPPSTVAGEMADEYYPDQYMEERFMDWRFFKDPLVYEKSYFYLKKQEEEQQ